jgi:hypothetical protein
MYSINYLMRSQSWFIYDLMIGIVGDITRYNGEAVTFRYAMAGKLEMSGSTGIVWGTCSLVDQKNAYSGFNHGDINLLMTLSTILETLTESRLAFAPGPKTDQKQQEVLVVQRARERAGSHK